MTFPKAICFAYRESRMESIVNVIYASYFFDLMTKKNHLFIKNFQTNEYLHAEELFEKILKE